MDAVRKVSVIQWYAAVQRLHGTQEERPTMRHRLLLPLLGIFAAFAMVAVSAQDARADRRDFTLYNESPRTILHVYVSASDESDWGEDILGRDVLLTGESVDILFDRFDGEGGKCLYDIKVVDSDGNEGYLYQVDLCSITWVSFS